MNLTDERLMEEISVWAEKNEDKNIFSGISKDETSYYVDRDSEDTYMMEYAVKTMAELRTALEEYSGLSGQLDILQKIVYAICQDRYRDTIEMTEPNNEQTQQSDDQMKLPEFIYVF